MQARDGEKWMEKHEKYRNNLNLSLKCTVVDSDPHWFGCPGSGSVLGMRIRIQDNGAWKLTNTDKKPSFLPFRKAFVTSQECFLTYYPVLRNRNYLLRFRFRFWLLKSYGSGSGSNFWKVMVPVPVPYLDHKKQIFQKKSLNFFWLFT